MTPVYGCYQGYGAIHSIYIDSNLPHRQLGETIHHELHHANQVDHEFGGDYVKYNHHYNMENALQGYQANRFEKEARRAQQAHDVFPLVKR